MDIRPLRESDDRKAFRSGDPDLDRFFQKYAGQNQFRHHVGTTYLAIEGGVIFGFATVSPGSIELEDLPPSFQKRLPRYPLPALRLVRLAADASARGRGVGSELLCFVFSLALSMSKSYGCVGVIVDAKPGAESFYSRFGFEPMDLAADSPDHRPGIRPLFVPLSLIEKAAGPSGAGAEE